MLPTRRGKARKCMLTTEEFRAWCVSLQLPKETEDFITAIRSGQPVRKVRGRAGNVAGRYPSPKMQRTIQFESQHVELWAIYAMERDEDVLEYYDQATRIPLSYCAASGRKTTQWHTPDFFVLRKGEASFEEWKPGGSLDKLAKDQPNRYQHAPTGEWRCPPGEMYARTLSLSYRVRSSAEYHPLYIHNLKFLQDFWAHPTTLEPSQEALVQTVLTKSPGLRLADLLNMYPDLPVDVIWMLLAKRTIFTDLMAASLMHHDEVVLYNDEEAAVQMEADLASSSRRPASLVTWDGRLFRVEEVGSTVTLYPELSKPLVLEAPQFHRLRQEGSMRAVTEATPSPTSPEVRQALTRASPEAQAAANERLKHILAYVAEEKVTPPQRTVQRWLAAFRAAEEQFGCGYVGLLPHVADRGNRTQRISEASMQLLEASLHAHYATPQAKRAAAVYRLYRLACEQQGIPPVSQSTFYRVRERYLSPEITAVRRGKRAAYASQPFFWYLDQTTPRHGERPFALAQLDHTKLDILLVSSVTGQPLEKPWLTLLTDSYSRRMLACYLSYDPPSYRSSMMAFRLCVQRYGRLPQELVVDRGADFGSVYFETLLSRYFMTKKERPANQPRAGSVIERLFGTTTTELLNQLSGNTQATKTPRLMTREVDPARQAVWTLDRFSACLSEWAYEVYDQMDHPALRQSPRAAFTQGMKLAGERLHRLIPYSEEFLMLTRPTTRTGRAQVSARLSITVNHLHYWNPGFQNPEVAGSSVPVRYEPYDMGVVYAWVSGQWLECFADDYAHVHGRSEREWHLILDEWRAERRQHGSRRVQIDGPLLARFLEQSAAEEQILRQQQRDFEEQSIREAIVSKQHAEVPGRLPDVPETIDWATIPQYEEYR